MTWFHYIVVAVFGLVLGSFFNVLIYRLPRGQTPGERSRCPSCGRTIRWYDNIPLISFVALKGRCRHCSVRISLRYPLIEFTTMALYVLCYWWSLNVVPALLSSERATGPAGGLLQPELFIGLLMASVLIICSAIDVDHGVVPNPVTYSGAALMTLLVVGLSLYRGDPGRIGTSTLAAVGGSSFLFLLSVGYGLLAMSSSGNRKMDGDSPEGASKDSGPEACAAEEQDELQLGMGMGDVKLVFFTGLAVGYFHWYWIGLVIFLGAFLGAAGALLAGKRRRERFAFAPYIAASGMITLIWGNRIIDLYLKLFR